MSDRAKRFLSIGIFSFGICVGLFGCAMSLPATFSIGVNDSPVAAIFFVGCFALFLPFCVIALWKRRTAGIGLILLAICWIYGLFDQRHYSNVVRHLPPDSISDFLYEISFALLPVALGIFALLTDRAGWPNLIRHEIPLD